MTREFCGVCGEREVSHPEGHCYSRTRRFPCNNCGRSHWGQYEGYRSYHRFSGMEVDFIWTNQRGEEKVDARGQRRHPC